MHSGLLAALALSGALLAPAQGEKRFGPLQVKPGETMRFFSQLEWRVDKEGDYCWSPIPAPVWL